MITTTHRRPRRVAALVAAATLALTAGACSSSKDSSTATGGSKSTATTAAPVAVDYSKPGPYKAGTTRISLGDREMIVFYPSDDAGIAGAEHLTSYNSGEAFAPELRTTIASIVPEFVQDIPIDAYKDAEPATKGGPFPVILHSHGFGGYYLFASQHYEQLASWGFVVAAPDHKSRNLSASATGQLNQGQTDTEDLAKALTTLEQANTEGPLKGSMNFDLLGVEGHSAGGSAAFRFAMQEPQVKTVIGYAPAPPVSIGDGSSANLSTEERQAKTKEALASKTPPQIPTMIVAADKDGAIALPIVQGIYDWLATPKRLIVVNNAGHNAFTDICEPIRAQGGLDKYQEKLPQFGPLLRLGGDGCTDGFTDPAQSAALINHSAVAQYRYVFGIDTSDASLQPDYLKATFPEAFGSEQSAK